MSEGRAYADLIAKLGQPKRYDPRLPKLKSGGRDPLPPNPADPAIFACGCVWKRRIGMAADYYETKSCGFDHWAADRG